MAFSSNLRRKDENDVGRCPERVNSKPKIMNRNPICKLYLLVAAALLGVGTVYGTDNQNELQVVTTQNTEIRLQVNGPVFAKGVGGTNQTIPTGAGTRMLWYPGKAAFRAGSVSGTFWDGSNIGQNSFAAGLDSKASGTASIALGTGVTASGPASIALGQGSTASSSYMSGVAIGYGTNASGYAGNVALGYLTSAGGTSGAIAMGSSTNASASGATAMGTVTQASNVGATAAGGWTIASGQYATSLGFWTTARTYGATVIGRYNALEPNLRGDSSSTWWSDEPVFIIGNGTGVPSDPAEVKNRNALTVYKDGKVVISKRQGDILMGTFGTAGSGD